jgi:UDP-GlcNAc:undecaprenyl-phosphate GlcNAc-1-phosphate transferase
MSGATFALALAMLTVLTACSFAGFRRLAVARDIVAQPSPVVRSHTGPVPYLGGPALFAPLLPALALVVAIGEPSIRGNHTAARWVCTACMLAVGLFDDVHPLTVGRKLIAQTTVCSIYLIAVSPSASPPTIGLELAFMLLVVNAFNLVDVMDGLLIVVAGVAVGGLLGGSFLASPINRLECWGLLAALAAAFAFNRPPARIYLGDAGALALGFFLASLCLTGVSSSPRPVGVAHLVAFAIPIFEVVFLTAARVGRGISPFRASPDHFALRLQDQAGWTQGRVLLATAAVGLVLDVWCFLPAERILGPIGIVLGATSILLAAAASVSCWRLVPRHPDLARS